MVVVAIGAILVIKPVPVMQMQDSQTATISSVLAAPENSYNFGNVSMAGGKVNKEFAFTNPGNASVEIGRIYTSCMCTTAVLSLAGKNYGPFGMPGHGLIPAVRAEVASGEKGIIKVIFDPAAHGPAGVGPIEREVYVQTGDGATLLFRIAALVTP